MLISRIMLFLVNAVFVVIGFLLVMRLTLRFFGANPNSPFVTWIYESSDSLLAPFAGIFPVTRLGSSFVIDVPVLFALIVYGFLGYLILEAIEVIAFRAEDRRHKH